MRCTQCGGDTKVVNTARAAHTIIRERKCLLCGEKYYSKERYIDTDLGRKELYRIKKKLYGH